MQMYPGNHRGARNGQLRAGRCRCVAREKEGAEPRWQWISCLGCFITTLRAFNCPVKKEKKHLDRTVTRVTLGDLDPRAALALSRHSCFLSALWTSFRLEVKRSKGKAAGAAIKSVCLLILFFLAEKAKVRRRKRRRKIRLTNSHLTQIQVDTRLH